MHFPDYKCLKVDLWLLVSEITVRQNILANDLKWVKQEIVAKKILKEFLCTIERQLDFALQSAFRKLNDLVN